MARIKMTAKRKKSCQEPEENQEVYSSTESDYHEENQSEATAMNTISSSQPSKSSSPSITPKIVKKSSSSTPSSTTASSCKIPKLQLQKKAKPSSPKPPSSSTKISDNTSLFDSAELEAVYSSKWQNKLVVNGKIIDLADIKQGGFNVEEMFEQLGWTSFFKINEPQYPRLVRALYAASKGSKGMTNFSMVLKGVHMEINPTTLCQILDIRDEGAHCLSETWYSQCVITRTSVLQNTLIKPPKLLVASNLVPLCRILHNICVHSITPRAGSFEKVTELDLMIIHHVIIGTPLCLGHVIFTFMLNAVVLGRFAPYGMILTKIFKFFKIPLEDEHSIYFNNTFYMKNIKQMKIQNDDRPASKKRKTRPSSSVSQNSADETPHPPPEDTPSPLIPEPTSPLRNSLDTTHSPASPVPTTTQSSPIHKLTPLREADPIPKDASKSTSPQHMEDGEELYFDMNLSYPPSPTDVPMASPPTVLMDEDVLPPPDFSQQIPPAVNFEKTARPLP
uniref:Uncharacterized protein LOC101508308 n=1 Tax=Cicer arietinum TaxID=3827 RepID=A0A1S3EG52_CICAR|nr:uncharacterized protein LOC101508308 [Cicer arietinum]